MPIKRSINEATGASLIICAQTARSNARDKLTYLIFVTVCLRATR